MFLTVNKDFLNSPGETGFRVFFAFPVFDNHWQEVALILLWGTLL